MFFELSKLFWQFMKPSHFLFWLALVGVVMCFTRFNKIGRVASLFGLIGILIISNIQLGSSSIRAQENKVKPLDLGFVQPDGILVLSGAVNRRVTESRGGLQVYEPYRFSRRVKLSKDMVHDPTKSQTILHA